MVKYCKKCGKKIGLFAEKRYFDPDFHPPYHRRNKKGVLLCLTCYDDAMKKAGFEIEEFVYEKIDSINHVKQYSKTEIIDSKNSQTNSLENPEVAEKILKDAMENYIISGLADIDNKIRNGEIRCPKCDSSHISSIGIYTKKNGKIATLKCGDCPYMWDLKL